MRQNRILLPVLAFSLLCGCAAGAVEPTPSPEATPEAHNIAACRVVDGAETGELLLAEEDGAVYTLSLGDLADQPELADLTDGMMVDVHFSGGVLALYPAQFEGVFGVSVDREAGVDDRCGLYLQVLEDLWNTDPGLNSDGLTHLGLDLSGLTDLTQGEKNALIYRFATFHGLTPKAGTYDELVEQGYITGTPLEGTDRLFYEWTDGILFSITTSEEATWSLPALCEGEEPPALAAFDAQKWRSGLGAYYFNDCIAQMDDAGSWSYTVGTEMIS